MAKLSSLSTDTFHEYIGCPRCTRAYRPGLRYCPHCGGELQLIKELESQGKRIDDYEIER